MKRRYREIRGEERRYRDVRGEERFTNFSQVGTLLAEDGNEIEMFMCLCGGVRGLNRCWGLILIWGRDIV